MKLPLRSSIIQLPVSRMVVLGHTTCSGLGVTQANAKGTLTGLSKRLRKDSAHQCTVLS